MPSVGSFARSPMMHFESVRSRRKDTKSEFKSQTGAHESEALSNLGDSQTGCPSHLLMLRQLRRN